MSTTTTRAGKCSLDDDEGSEMVFDWVRALGSVLYTTAAAATAAMTTFLRKLIRTFSV